MARLRIIVVAQETDGDVYALATCKFYQPGTASASGSTTSGTPFAGNLYAAISGGSPISTTQTLNSSGTLVVWTTTKGRVDVGIEPAGNGTAFVRAYETMELDPADVMTAVSGEQTVIVTGTIAAPSLAQSGNLDTGFNVDSGGDPAVVKDGVGILETISTSTYLRSPDGTDAATLSNAGVFAAPGLLRGIGVYMVEDEGMVYGTTTTNAAANKTAWTALIAKIAAAGQHADIYINESLPMDAGINLSHGLGYGRSINIIAKPGRGSFLWNGTAGPFLSIGTASNSLLSISGMYDVGHYFDDLVTSGATILLGDYAGNYTFEGGKIAQASGVGCQVGVQSSIGFGMRHYKIETRLSGAGTAPVGILLAHTTSGSGPQLLDVSIDGYSGLSYAMRYVNTANIDTPIMNMCHFRQHYAGIYKNSGGGKVENLQSNNLYLDEMVKGILLEPPDSTSNPGTATVGLWNFNQSWISCTGANTSNVAVSKSNGGFVGGLVFEGGVFKNANYRSFEILACDGFFLRGGEVYGSSVVGAGDAPIYLGASAGTYTTNVLAAPNYVISGSTAIGTIYAESGVTPFTFDPGVTRGTRVNYAGALSSARVIKDHSFLA